MPKIVSILGAGWLGLPLARALVGAGYAVNASTTREAKLPEVAETGARAFLLAAGPDAPPAPDAPDFWRAGRLVLNIPPGRGPGRDAYAETVRQILRRATDGGTKRLIFASSTSVYPPLDRTVTEADAAPHDDPQFSGAAALTAEQVVREFAELRPVIVRLAGLYGYERQLIRYVSGKTGLKNGGVPVNLIHRDDCVAIFQRIIDRGLENETWNAVSDEHPTRQTYYETQARHFGLAPPVYEEPAETPAWRIVDNAKLKRDLEYVFLHPDPLAPAP